MRYEIETRTKNYYPYGKEYVVWSFNNKNENQTWIADFKLKADAKRFIELKSIKKKGLKTLKKEQDYIWFNNDIKLLSSLPGLNETI